MLFGTHIYRVILTHHGKVTIYEMIIASRNKFAKRRGCHKVAMKLCEQLGVCPKSHDNGQ